MSTKHLSNEERVKRFCNPGLYTETRPLSDTKYTAEIPVTVSSEQFENELEACGGLDAIAPGETKRLPSGATVTVTKRIAFGPYDEVQS